MNMNGRKILIFDFDGTIADTFPFVLQIVDKLSIKYNFAPVDEMNLEKYRAMEVKDIFKEANVPFWKLPFMVRDAQNELKKVIREVEPIKGILPILQELKKQHRLMLLTSNTKGNVDYFLAKYELNVFEHIRVGASIFGKSRQINKIVRDFSLQKSDCVYIGDEVRDIQAAHKSGIKVVTVTWGYNSMELLKRYNPDFIITRPTELSSIIKDL